jgi:hypothetical protein
MSLPFAAYAHQPSNHRSTHSSRPLGSPSNNNKPHQFSNNNVSFGIHRTRDDRCFITNTNPQKHHPIKPLCDLCFNKHVNPWHSTADCPLRHPTHIINKDIRERVMQYNALNGSMKKDFTKTQDTSRSLITSTTPATGRRVTILDSVTDNHESTPLINTTPSPTSPSNDVIIQLEEGTTTPDNNEIIDTEYFNLPIPPVANTGYITPTSFSPDDISPGELIHDHEQYLNYNS